ncbi:MAG TPA: ATP-binding cassette domain-containing protein [Candidatus Thermoplasmatota archaeon]|nr:ATP-binding cassette domain-containing protein [Candidatus Thermoplasmatota archaeon]
MEALRLDGVSVAFAGRKVLDKVSLSVDPGELVVVEGRSGSGKSTLLNVAAGLRTPDAGSVELFEEPFDARQASASAQRAKHIGLVFQHLHLLPELTVQENIELPLLLAKWPRAERPKRSAELLEQFEIRDLAARRPATLSGGEQQRVAICRALAPIPGLLLVDEPTGALDEANARSVAGALQAAARSGAAVLVTSHDELLRRTGTLHRIANGRLVQVRE